MFISRIQLLTKYWGALGTGVQTVSKIYPTRDHILIREEDSLHHGKEKMGFRGALEMKKDEFSEFQRCKGLVEKVASEEEHCRKE